MADQGVTASGEMMDFSVRTTALQFKIDGDVFTGVRDLAADTAFEFSAYATALSADSTNPENRKNIMKSMIRALLVPESAERFIARLSDTSNPIGLATCMDVVHFLFERYGLRPTQPDSDSSSGPDNPESGTSSTVSTSAAV